MTKVFVLLASAALGTAAFAQTTTTPDSAATPPMATPAPTGTGDTAPAVAPAPTDTSANASAAVPPMSNPSAGVATTAQADYPVCSRTVTDKCTQRGSRRR